MPTKTKNYEVTVDGYATVIVKGARSQRHALNLVEKHFENGNFGTVGMICGRSLESEEQTISREKTADKIVQA